MTEKKTNSQLLMELMAVVEKQLGLDTSPEYSNVVDRIEELEQERQDVGKSCVPDAGTSKEVAEANRYGGGDNGSGG